MMLHNANTSIPSRKKSKDSTSTTHSLMKSISGILGLNILSRNMSKV